MPVITVGRLNRFMQSPDWTEDVKLAIADIIGGVESNLEGALYKAYITPRPMAEVAPILRTGLVATRQVVHSVSKVDGVVVDEDHPLASPWMLTENRLRRLGTPTPAPVYGVDSYTSWGAGTVPGTDAVGQVEVIYMGGWGDEPALTLAMLKKCEAIALNRFDDSIRARNMDAERAPYVVKEEWTKDELGPLGIYRNLTARR